MRFKLTKTVTFFLFIVHCLVFYYIVRYFGKFNEFTTFTPQVSLKPTTQNPIKHISKIVTVVIRDFEPYENDVTLTAQSFINVFPNINILILYDVLPYPPLDITLTNSTLANVKLINLSPNLKTPLVERYPVFEIKTKYVLFVPDSTRLTSRQSVQAMVNDLRRQPNSLVVAPLNGGKKDFNCLRINVNVKEWTLKYSTLKSLTCDAVSGRHLILLETDILRKLTYAFFMPFPQSLYIQTSLLPVKVNYYDVHVIFVNYLDFLGENS